MLRRSLMVIPLAAALAAGVVGVAGGSTRSDPIHVHVRVGGQQTTIFGAAEPLVDVAATPLDALETASAQAEFYYHVTQSSFGPYVDQIGRYAADGSSGWVFKVNGASPPVGADKVSLKEGDRVLWYWATFGADGTGPKTTYLVRTKKDCYQLWLEDDAGARSAPASALLTFDGRPKVAKGGKACIGKHKTLVRGSVVGEIRSNAVK